MPGSNCSIFGCGTCRNQSDFGIFKIPASISEKHFNSDQIYFYPTRKLLKEGTIPALNLPEKSHQIKITVRNCSATDKREICCKQLTPQISIPSYKDISDFIRKVKSLKLNGWIATFNIEYAIFEKLKLEFVVPLYEIYVTVSGKRGILQNRSSEKDRS